LLRNLGKIGALIEIARGSYLVDLKTLVEESILRSHQSGVKGASELVSELSKQSENGVK